MSLVHASAVLVGETGVLIRGASGSGKSALVLALLFQAQPKAWLVADDQVALAAEDGRLIATVPPAIAGRLEIRGQGIVSRPHVSPARIRLVVDLLPPESCPRMPSAEEATAIVEGVALPRLMLPIGGHDGAIRVQAALQRLGQAESR
jgi:HPr kinase/phosphorylase